MAADPEAARVGAGAVAAVDLGASSGRVIIGRVADGRVSLEEVHRFPNEPVQLDTGLYWDALRLHHEILAGLRKAARAAPDLRSIGIDTWGVDVGMLDADGALVGNPVHHRDPRNVPAVDRVHGRVSQAQLYARTGLQFMSINTLYQLEAARITPSFSIVRRVVPLPDLLGYWLTGVVVAERTHASTTGLLDARSGAWDTELLGLLGLDPALLPPLADPGTIRGPVLPAVRAVTGLADGCVVTLVGSHDTASAIVGVPATSGDVAYISSGTWSLVGVEAAEPILTEASRQANFTNERGVDGTVRFLRNVTGLWLLQESLRTWDRTGSPEPLPPLIEAAAALPAGGPVFDPQDAVFLAPGDMPARISGWLGAAGRPVPADRPALARCILDSLAAEYARTIDDAARLADRSIEVIHVVGGGAQNSLLCQLTANATGRTVVAGPVEATAIGNILVQARALGLVRGGLEELRRIVRDSETLQRYAPEAIP
jgi:rhamnulokinase